MREPVNADRLRRFMRELAVRSRASGRVYLTGGASAVLFDWRKSTVDIDITIIPEDDRVLRVIPELKEALHVNVELASPAHFIPPLPGWEERSPFIAREGTLSFHHYDFYSQCLAKIERGHRKDQQDVAAMLRSGLVEARRLLALFDQIEPELYRYPAIDPARFRSAVLAVVRQLPLPL
ncbi:MAG TPA: DUF6036 family nucleotidyltransferase [Thermoanaerobaculia bacterium]|nr:DUF6036 family nucleotidyltransferase [Thermoanaerobaculia bacterium]